MSGHKVSNGELREGYEFRQDALRVLGYGEEGCPSNAEALDKLRWLKREWEEYRKFSVDMNELLKGDVLDGRGLLGRVEDLHLYESAGKLFKAKLQDQLLLAGMVVNDDRLLARVVEVMKEYRAKSDEMVNFLAKMADIFGLTAGCVNKTRIRQHARELMDIVQSKPPKTDRDDIYALRAFRSEVLRTLDVNIDAFQSGRELREYVLGQINSLIDNQRKESPTALEMFQEAILRELKIDLNRYPTDHELIVAARDMLRAYMSDEDRPAVEYLFKSFKDHDDYAGLAAVLLGALEQAAYGKGRERHANDLPFEDQPMNAICDILGSPEGMAYQVTKKVAEALKMPTYEQQERELFGAINYTAGIIIWLNRHKPV
ncbi:TPA: hypothetical protein ACGCAJ_004748 [Serratia marcescens]